jgi:primosomal protein N'
LVCPFCGVGQRIHENQNKCIEALRDEISGLQRIHEELQKLPPRAEELTAYGRLMQFRNSSDPAVSECARTVFEQFRVAVQ